MIFCVHLVIVIVIVGSLRALKLEDTMQEAFCLWSCKGKNCLCERNNTINYEPSLLKAGLLPSPEILCRETNLIQFGWNRLEQNAVYFFEVQEEKEHFFTKPISLDTMRFSHLNENTTYSFKLWSVSFDSNISINISESQKVTIRKYTDEILRPKNVDVNKLVLDSFTYNASIKWEPNNDLPCAYELVLYGSDGNVETFEIDNPKLFYNKTLSGLKFDSNYSISIRAKSVDGNRESPIVSHFFPTPSCLETYLDLSKCAPEKPKNLTVTESLSDKEHNLYDVKLQWTLPILPPDYYLADFVNVIPKNFSKYEQHLNISGLESSAVFKNAKLGTYYQVKLVAWSTAGPSNAIVVDRHVVSTSALPNNESWSTLELVLVVVGPILFLITIAVLILFIGHYKSKRKRFEQRCNYFKDLEQKFSESLTPQPIEDIPDKWELKPEVLHLQTVLGEGAFGIVRRAFLKTKENGPLEVAIKMLKESPSVEEIRQFHSEIEIMKSVGSHPHLVSIIGCITKGRPEGPLLVVEYCAQGDLQTYLRNVYDKLTNCQLESEYMDSSGKNFANKAYDLHIGDQPDFSTLPKDLLSYARQICIGMEYLSNLRVVHRDLAARNVLVSGDSTVKISDFGLSRDIYRDNVYYKKGAGKLPMRWMALESLTHQRYTTQSDVWSFGILLWEIVTLGASPYPGVATQDLLALLKSGYRMEKPVHCTNEIYAIMRNCWNATPKKRPTFDDLKKALETLLENVTQYLELDPSVCKTNPYQNGKVQENTTSSERYVKPVSVCSSQ